jgi:hypothetical protein
MREKQKLRVLETRIKYVFPPARIRRFLRGEGRWQRYENELERSEASFHNAQVSSHIY